MGAHNQENKASNKFNINQPVQEKSKWSYGNSFIFGFTLLTTGFLLETFQVPFIKIPAFPGNIYIGLVFINLLLFSYFTLRTHPVIVWLMSVPASISAISFYTLLIISMGFIPQDQVAGGMISLLGLDHVVSSWPFLIIQFFFLVTLGMVTLKRTIPFKFKNWGFILNHLGLWLIIFAAALGTGDFRRLNLLVFENETASIAVDRAGNRYRLPFAVHLYDFNIKQYPPKMALVDQHSGTIIATSLIPAKNDPKSVQLDNWKIIIDKVEVIPTEAGAREVYKFVARQGESVREGLLHLQPDRNPAVAQLNQDQLLALLPPEPQKYISQVKIMDQEQEKEDSIVVNQPSAFAGWKIYQSSYDESAGADSAYSVFEVITDPWIPVVYLGLFMLIVGAVYLMWTGNNLKSDENGLE
ncbi:MAG: cytochrome c biogenesis protein ResB [Candidatus Cyclobacteriaceae bacterium M3_2C_046]